MNSSLHPVSGGCVSDVAPCMDAGRHSLMPISISLILTIPGPLHSCNLDLKLFWLRLNFTEALFYTSSFLPMNFWSK